jgi:hypothetical protein
MPALVGSQLRSWSAATAGGRSDCLCMTSEESPTPLRLVNGLRGPTIGMVSEGARPFTSIRLVPAPDPALADRSSDSASTMATGTPIRSRPHIEQLAAE